MDSHHYHLDETIFIVSVIRSLFSFYSIFDENPLSKHCIALGSPFLHMSYKKAARLILVYNNISNATQRNKIYGVKVAND